MNANALEKFLAAQAAKWLSDNKAADISALAPLNLVVENDAVKFLDDLAAKDAGPAAFFVEGLLNKYGAQLAPELAKLEGQADDKLVAFLNAVANA